MKRTTSTLGVVLLTLAASAGCSAASDENARSLDAPLQCQTCDPPPPRDEDPPPPPPPSPLSVGLYARYCFDGAQIGTDCSGQGRDLFSPYYPVYRGTPSAKANLGNALLVYPNGGNLTNLLPGNAGAPFPDGDSTITAFVNHKGSHNRVTVVQTWAPGPYTPGNPEGASAPTMQILTQNAGGVFGAYSFTAGDSLGGVRIDFTPSSAAGWHHVAIARVRATGVFTVFWDGAALASAVQAASGPAGGNNYITLGVVQSSVDNVAFRADEVRFYTRALSVSEIGQLASGAL